MIDVLGLLQGKGKVAPPKPMIDNPNAAATKSSNLIRPLALKASESPVTDGNNLLQL